MENKSKKIIIDRMKKDIINLIKNSLHKGVTHLEVCENLIMFSCMLANSYLENKSACRTFVRDAYEYFLMCEKQFKKNELLLRRGKIGNQDKKKVSNEGMMSLDKIFNTNYFEDCP